MKVQAQIDFSLVEAWEIWVADVEIPDDIPEEEWEDYIKEHYADLPVEFVTMKDSGNAMMTVDSVNWVQEWI